MSNFGLTIAVARAVDEELGGVFTYVFLIFSLAIGLSRAVTTDPLLIRFSAASDETRGRAVAQAAGSSTGAGLTFGLVCLAVGLALGDQLGEALALLVIILPGQLLQDSWRSAAFATGAVHKAAVNDLVRFLVQFAAIAACIVSETDELGWYLAAWALGAWVGAGLGAWQFGLPAAPAGVIAWLRQHSSINVRLGGDYLINMGSFTLTTSLLVVLLGFAATGGLRFAQTLLGPIQLVFGALTAFMVPLLARRLAARGPRALRTPALLLAGFAFTISATVVVTLLLLPDSIGRELLGSSWDEAERVMAAVGTTQCLISLVIGAMATLKVLSRVDLLFRATLVQAPLILGLGVGGGAWLGIEGAAWGIALAHLVGGVLMVVLAVRATGATTADRDDAPPAVVRAASDA
ncbi:Na+-driven multidrug efflux pump [Blastococcus saxobsidens]|uniref:Putative Na+-driven multidrug efflux pump n=1 Tax=Blastococcus saxobsidens (strain DD2) TaxID=1146883 RepID=H6RN31_BLASD|nr:Na+-driven multidrug efflux pump [Blastococcus saxobsidens]CCG01384.1 putative Na+-driven multidrug efflux pump [Blastococcus saxobsidens DD2]